MPRGLPVQIQNLIVIAGKTPGEHEADSKIFSLETFNFGANV